MSRESDGADMAALLVQNMKLAALTANSVAAAPIEAMTDLAMVEGRLIRLLREDVQRTYDLLGLYERWLESVS